jgi:glyoxylase-like metal-dependent hydrolase (beta-lactamase superfamily II)
MLMKLLLAFLITLFATGVHADVSPAEPQDEQGLKPVKVSENIWAIVGPLTNRTPENLGNNATFGLIITTEGLVVVDPGGSRKGAEALHAVIRDISDKPIKYVINTGGQDHRWFGNGYFRELGARIISSKAAAADHEARFNDQVSRLTALIGDENFAGTEAVYADIFFDETFRLTVGETAIEIYHKGQAHTPGDSYVWMPAERVVFSGDIVYVDRMLGIGEQSSSKQWVEVFEAMAALDPEIVVPGHGGPVKLEKARKDTYDYLVTLRERTAAFIDEGGDISEVADIRQDEFAYLQNYDTLKGRNAQKVYSELEFE